MSYPALAVANYLIEKGNATGTPLSPMKLQKLVYFVEGWNMAFTGNELIRDPIQAWQYGPVIPAVYHEFKTYGNGAIQNMATTYSIKDGKICTETLNIPESDEFTCKLIDRVWEVYGGYSAVQLSAMTHEDGTPWHKVYAENGEATRGLQIPKALMKEYFSALKAQNAAGKT